MKLFRSCSFAVSLFVFPSLILPPVALAQEVEGTGDIAEVEISVDDLDVIVPEAEIDLSLDEELSDEKRKTAEALEAEDMQREAMSTETTEDTSASNQLYQQSVPEVAKSSGAFTYAVPIKVPSYRGLEPGLSLSYMSSGVSRGRADAFMGVGWTLSGMSSIERKSVGGGVPFLKHDKDLYYLDGVELMACAAGSANPYPRAYPVDYFASSADPSCAAGGNMTARNTDYRKVVMKTKSLHGRTVEYFEVTSVNGIKKTFLTYPDLSGEQVTGTASDNFYQRKFFLTEVRDTQPAPNVVRYTYTRENDANGRTVYPLGISYNGYNIEFKYQGMSVPEASFATGENLAKVMRRLDSVRIKNGGDKLRAYKLNYTQSAVTKATLLESVQEIGRDYVVAANGLVDASKGTRLPKTSFTYSDDAVKYHEVEFPNVPKFRRGMQFFDIDEDGRPELFLPEVRYSYKGSDGDGGTETKRKTYFSGEAAAYQFNPSTFTMAAIPERIPYISFGLGRSYPIWVFPKSQTPDGEMRSVYTTRLTNNTNFKYPTHVSYLDHTGAKIDGLWQGFAMSGRSTGGVVTARNQRYPTLVGYNDMMIDLKPDNVSKFYYNRPSHRCFGNNRSGQYPEVIRGDLTGNGLTDVMCERETYHFVPENNGSWVYHTKGRPRFGKDEVHFPGDLNGDGKVDHVSMDFGDNSGADRNFYVQLSHGLFLGSNTKWVADRDMYGSDNLSGLNDSTVADFNGDGLVDALVGNYSNENKSVKSNYAEAPTKHAIFFSKGYDVVEYAENQQRYWVEKPVAVIDIDGNGLPDIIHQTSPAKISFARGLPANMLTSVSTPLGGRYDVTYAPSSMNYGSDPIVKDDQIPGVRQVVSRITRRDGRGNVYATDYRYEGGRYDHANRASLGFSRVTERAYPGDGAAPIQTFTWFDVSSYARKGLVTLERTYENGTLFSEKGFSYDVAEYSGNAAEYASKGPYRQIMTAKASHEMWGGRMIGTRSSYDYDLYGNVLIERNFGFANSKGNVSNKDDEVVQRTYKQLPGKYIMGLTATEMVNAFLTPDASTALRRQAYAYDNYGRLIAQRVFGPQPTSGTWRTVERLNYDNYGNVTRRVDARGQETRYEYDTSKHLFLTKQTNALGHVTLQSWNTTCQLPVSSTDANGLKSTSAYDGLCRIHSEMNPRRAYVLTAYEFLGNPNYQRIKTTVRTGSTQSAMQQSLSYEYVDGLGRAWKSQNSGRVNRQDTADGFVTIEKRYDGLGRLMAQSLPVAHMNYVPGVLGGAHEAFTYDALGRMLTTKHADGSVQRNAYTAHGTRRWGPLLYAPATVNYSQTCSVPTSGVPCIINRAILDWKGRTAYQIYIDQNGTDSTHSGSTWRSSYFKYDLLDRLVRLADQEGLVYSYSYDMFGNRIQSVDPGLGTWSMRYDNNGNLLEQIDSKGQKIQFAYDALNRVTRKDVRRADGALEARSSFGYDGAGLAGRSLNFRYQANIGQLTSQSQGDLKITTAYNLHGPRFVWHKYKNQPEYRTVTQYYVNGSIERLGLPVGSDPTRIELKGVHDYDAAGRLIKIGGTINDISYNAWGQPTRVLYANGTEDRFQYSATRGWLSRSETRGADGKVLHYVEYVRSASGRVMSMRQSSEPKTVKYTYDYKGQLLSARSEYSDTGQASTVSFSYDKAGRMTKKSDLASRYHYNTVTPKHAPKQLTLLNGQTVSLSYDANGNMTRSFDGRVMTYDSENRPLSVTGGGATTRYEYWPDGTRATKTEGADTTLYYGMVELQNLGQSDEKVFTYPHANVRSVDGEWQFLHKDQLNSVKLITGASGEKIKQSVYAPFGEATDEMLSLSLSASDETKGFIGERYDADAGLQYLNARYYDPRLGRFIPADIEAANDPGRPAIGGQATAAK